MADYSVDYSVVIQLNFQTFVHGALALVFAHNLVVSVFYYKARQSTPSNFIKIIFNFGGLLRACMGFSIYVTPPDVSDATCKGITHMYNLAQFVFLSSLSLFMLWRLRQIENKYYDLAIGAVLFFVRIVIHLTQVGLTTPVARELPDTPGVYLCGTNIKKATSRALFYSYIGIDVLIDIYVTIRLVQILSRANRNAKDVAANMRRPHRRSLFTAVMYWNFLRLFASFLHHAINIYSNATNLNDPYKFWSFQFFALIFLSYSITADAEIVRTIEGRPVNLSKGSGYGSTGGTDKTSKSYQSNLTSPRFPTHSYKSQDTSFKDDFDYDPRSTSTQLASNKQQPVYEDVNGQKMGVSMKRASFFEWASIVVGFRRNGSDEQYNIENDHDVEKADVNDIMDERHISEERVVEDSEADTNNIGPERDLSIDHRRSSTFSGDTITSGVQLSADNSSTIHAL